ncbi:MAG: hypothetical protein ACRDIB_17130, partial [Ardenticatenaceae bacterium]
DVFDLYNDGDLLWLPREYNNSTSGIKHMELAFMDEDTELVDGGWDLNGDHCVDVTGYTDQAGELIWVDGSEPDSDGEGLVAAFPELGGPEPEVGQNVIPVEVSHIPANVIIKYDPGTPGGSTDGLREYDTSPEDEYWIDFPN